MLTTGWAVALTAIFGGTGAYCVARLATRRWAGIGTIVDLNHVAMSVAMLVMVWWPSFSGGTWPQVAVFAGVGVVFVHHLAGSETIAARAGALAHVVMNGGMVWMLVAMPALMAAGGMAGMDAMAGMHHGGGSDVSSGVQAWVTMLTWDVVVVLALGAAWWIVQAVRTRGHRVLCGCHGLACAGMAGMLALMTPAL
ncbi:DUF5134 domain-containing protein [Kribbella solani]|uniref:DUF5134 domain-containing protein n=1 Tax=Kribbella solani TaxID=236067 RepID=UPI0029AAC84C|nr:DUF5134 domain-containing protein [Kribbella solani]MDX2969202.1 DUF5134 domain-containing protein [Kribbella solani]MDX3006315.1 DUF5134 domain-containing protein [Kribbella solani]